MKTVFITGANRGIGFGFVRQYLSDGWLVIAAIRNPKSATVFDELPSVDRERLTTVAVDVGDEASIDRLPEALSGVRLDCVINNAAISIDENLGEWTGDALAENFRVNTIGPALIAQALVPQLNPGAKLINMSSGMGSCEYNLHPLTNLDAYTMTKAAVNILSRRLAEKLRDKEVAVAALSPGWVQTDMGGPGATMTVEDAVATMVRVIDQLTLEQSGSFLSETGEPLAW
ncbi:MAG: SDR family oxidoreductase [Verrucomicrobiota bacterium]